MSAHAVREFMKDVQENAALREEMCAAVGDPELGIHAEDLANFAAQKGYVFTLDELQREAERLERETRQAQTVLTEGFPGDDVIN